VKEYSNLFLKLKYLYAKIDYQQEVYEQAKIGFEEFATKFCEDNGIEIKQPSSFSEDTSVEIRGDDEISDIDIEKQSTHIKLLFRKIAIKAHPDKLVKFGEEERDRKTKLFLEAREAAESGQWFTLVDIAQSLGITPPKPDTEQLELLQGESENIDKRIQDIESTYAWILHNAQSEEQRKLIMIAYLKNFDIDLAKDDN
jgi:hypothetical protein